MEMEGGDNATKTGKLRLDMERVRDGMGRGVVRRRGVERNCRRDD